MPDFRSLFRRLLTAAASLYALAMVAYLALRMLFGDGYWWLSLANSFAHVLFLPLLPLLALVAVARARLAALRLLPLAVIGGAWFAPYFLPKPQPAAAGPTVRVVTLNIWGRTGDHAWVESWLRQVEADIVLLQEVTPEFAAAGLPRLRDLYPYQFSRHTEPEAEGCAILSRYAILETGFADGQTSAEFDPYRLVVDVGGRPVAVYTVHLAWPAGTVRLGLPLDNFYLKVALGFDDRIRNRQIAGLVEHLLAEPYPYIVAGDFNTSASSTTYHQLAAVMRDSFREAGSGLGATWPVSAARGLPAALPPLIRIDYIWHSHHFRAVEAQTGPRLRSDHLPVLALLELPPAA